MTHGSLKVDELESFQEVGARFGISDRRVSQLVKSEGLTTHPDALDKRRKLLGPEQVRVIERALQVRGHGGVSQAVRADDSAQFEALSSHVTDLNRRVQELSDESDKRIQRLYDTIANITQTNVFLLQRVIAVEQHLQLSPRGADDVVGAAKKK